MRRQVRVHRLGRIRYDEAHQLQQRLQEARVAGDIPDTLLLLEHEPVITLGRKAAIGNVLLAKEMLAARGIELHETGRGGDVTYHGPGQLVGYPIIDLKPDRQDVRRYVRELERLMVDVCATYGITAERIDTPGLEGTWVRSGELGDRKIGAVGVRISRWVTMHGFALNVTTDLSHFALIVPCGIRDKGVTSLERELDRRLPMDEVMGVAEQRFAAIFDADLEHAPLPELPAPAAHDHPMR
ncbi:lipoyl(octanoyl) transferase LipB [Sandaracinus amylolyticus]|uniref:Octanoyltransferase n=1 Tax=Sandaracinus amylolyticus TaxID=927083 RepID=A0A0F6SGI2_9BACT|nr:lipoyl(octanoyl) transferase LipB [Sandaracinus amylolyticus]AKF08739.1 Octanoate-[acyl-carrier-protein]-protein-N-octanoyltransferase [Sandaracinus amylolyticus]